jgi:phosphatidylglycerophosphatase A
MKALSRILATFFGIGFFPLIPGTAASAVAAIAWRLALSDLAWPLYALMLAVLFLAGSAASASYVAEIGRPDPGRIVIDEIVGQLFALSVLPGAWVPAAVGFALFRFFDIIKPWPIRKLERLPGGWGIMADDVAAGLAAAVLGRLILLWV